MEKLVDLMMTKLFQLAENVCGKCSSIKEEPAAPQKAISTIRFSNEDKMVEGNLFS